MKCPRCQSDKARLSWLREQSVSYWCPVCHVGFEVGRHKTRSFPSSHLDPSADLGMDGVVSAAGAN